MMLTKTIRTPVKALTNEEGEPTGFTGYAAVFDNIDLGGDKIIKGAFSQTLASRYPESWRGNPRLLEPRHRRPVQEPRPDHQRHRG